MNTVIVTHQVASYDTWKAGFDADEPRRAAAGITGHTVGRLPGSPEQAVVILQIEDLGVYEKMMSDPGLQAAMKAAGVLAPPTVMVVPNTTTKAYAPALV